MVDPPDDEPDDTHIYLWITGQAARDIYVMIDSEATQEPCLDDGTLSKQSGNIQCDFDPGKDHYRCYLSIEVSTNKVGPGVVC